MESPSLNQENESCKALLNLATESWRFSRIFSRVVAKLDAGDQNRYLSQYRYYVKQLEDSLSNAGFSLVNLEGQHFDPGMAATPLNIEDFAPEDMLFVEQMLEPVIMGNEGLVRTGTIILGKVDKI